MSVRSTYRHVSPITWAESRKGYAFVYVIAAGRHCKIGWSRDVENRLEQCRTHCPVKPRIAFTQKVLWENATTLEGHAHRALADKRTNGEWFRVSPKVAREAIVSSRSILGYPDYNQAAPNRLLQRFGFYDDKIARGVSRS